ncbi:ABC transporter permease [Reticulibacter mediterranei]|uniref:ABC transporter permease n=1 Tax=Reticulibacter mediterranei TaxID=2778369 RepID=A0A8J3MZ89_9CHLR|nr:carbohydrate ABC transporter permease [Reticulibacter mediterranei]GHO92874.1 ABC transporter permease [Reticulibacter mediterranei]
MKSFSYSGSRPHTTARKLSGYIILVSVALLIVMPFLWVVSLALKGPQESLAYPPDLIPHALTFNNFSTVLSNEMMLGAFINSVLVAAIAIATNVAFTTLAGYAFARLRFPGREVVFFILIASTMVPGAVTLVPLFLMTRGFPLMGGNDLLGHGGVGLLNTIPGLVLPHVIQALNIFLARQFFLELPEDWAEAARLDGASEFLTFLRVYLPLSRPMVATIAILSFTSAWEDFLWPLVVTSSPDSYTVQVALNVLAGTGGGGSADWGPVMAAAVLATLPLLLVFLFFQRHFVEGLASGGVKG